MTVCKWLDFCWIGLIVALCCVSLTLAHANTPPPNITEFEDPIDVPEHQFMNEEGELVNVSLDVWKGKTIILNFWATWCTPCIKELPSLDRLNIQGNQQLVVVPVLMASKDPSQIQQFYDKVGVTSLPKIRDHLNQAQKQFAVRALPATFIINPQGKIMAHVEGAIEWDSPEMIRYLMYK